jgi:cell division protein FtsL
MTPKSININKRKIETLTKFGKAFIRVFTKFFILLIAFMLRKGLKTLKVLSDLKLVLLIGRQSINLYK